MIRVLLVAMVLMAITPAYAGERSCGDPTLIGTAGKYQLFDISCDSDMKNFVLTDDKDNKLFTDSYTSSVLLKRSGDNLMLIYKAAGERLSQEECMKKCPKQKELSGWHGECQAVFLQTRYYNVEKKAMEKNEAHRDEILCLSWGLQ